MTAQFLEQLILEGEETAMANCPAFPINHPRIQKLSIDSLQDVKSSFLINNSACWRKYIGTWEIKDGLLYLVKLIGLYQITEGPPIFVDWFTGVLRVPKGEILKYEHMGFASDYEQDIYIKIENGIVIKTRIIDNRIESPLKGHLSRLLISTGEYQFPEDNEE